MHRASPARGAAAALLGLFLPGCMPAASLPASSSTSSSGAAVAAQVPAVSPSGAFRHEVLAPGVHLFRPVAQDGSRTNSVVVERGDGLLVINAQPSPAAARELLGELRSRVPGEVRYLVLAHPHADAAGGASAFPSSTLLIGSVGARTSLDDPTYDFGAEMHVVAGESWKEPPRPKITLVLHGNAVLDDPERAVFLFPIARAHTTGDLLVELPEADILVAGSLLFPNRNPYPGDAKIGGWVAALNNVAAGGRGRIVPLEGPILDAREVRAMRESLAWIRGEVETGYLERLTSDQIPERILASPRLASFFDPSASPSFVRALAERAVAEAIVERRKYGLEK